MLTLALAPATLDTLRPSRWATVRFVGACWLGRTAPAVALMGRVDPMLASRWLLRRRFQAGTLVAQWATQQHWALAEAWTRYHLEAQLNHSDDRDGMMYALGGMVCHGLRRQLNAARRADYLEKDKPTWDEAQLVMGHRTLRRLERLGLDLNEACAIRDQGVALALAQTTQGRRFMAIGYPFEELDQVAQVQFAAESAAMLGQTLETTLASIGATPSAGLGRTRL